MAELFPLLLLASLAGEPAEQTIVQSREWVSLDLYHLSRTLPSFSRTIETPINPGIQASYHRTWFGRSVTGGSSFQAAFASFDELFWSLSVGTGFEGVWRSSFGIYVNLGLRLDYARIFTGSNNFVFDDGRYRQATDYGRGFLRATFVDLSLGYSPPVLRRLNVIPALRYAWMVDFPLYENDGANPWSYTTFGPSVLWTW